MRYGDWRDPDEEVLEEVPTPTGTAPGKQTMSARIPSHGVGVRQASADGASPGKRTLTAGLRPVIGGGRPMPDPLREQMETSFGANFADVRLRESAQVADLGARAYAQGSEISFAPGRLDTESQPGKALIGHELAHVVQQSEGRVAAPAQAKGAAFVREPALEREADDLGARAARGEVVRGNGTQRSALAANSVTLTQGYFGEEYVDAAVEGAGNLIGEVASWGLEQISDAAALLEFIGAVSESVARQMIIQIAAANTRILLEFVRLNPAHQLAVFIASQLTLEDLISLATSAGEEIRGVVVSAGRAINQLGALIAGVYAASAEAARQLAHEIETEHLPAIFEACAELAYDLFYEWWPSNTGFEAQVTLALGATVPVWPEPPIYVGGDSEFQGEIKLYNKSHEGAPQIEFECGTQNQDTTRVGLFIPEGAQADARSVETVAKKIKTTTNFADIDWNTGLIDALRNADREGAFNALCTGVGNIIGATQFEFTYASSSAEGMGGQIGLDEVATVSASSLRGMGFQLTIQTPTENDDGKIEAQGQLTMQNSLEIGASIPGTPANLGPTVGYLIRNASAAIQAQGSIGGRLNFKIPKSSITDMRTPQFDWVEFFVGGQVGARIAREQGAVEAEASIRFSRDSLSRFVGTDDPDSGIGGVNLRDGVTAEELRTMLPFSQLALKGSVALDSGLAGLALRELVAGDSTAIEFLTGNPSVGGKVEIEMVFTTDRMVALLAQLGFVLRDGNDDTQLEGPALSAIQALLALNIEGFLAGVGAAASDFGTFMWESVDKIKVDLHADAAHGVGSGVGGIEGGGPGGDATGDVTGGANLRLRAAYQNEFSRQDIERGLAAARAFLLRALPAPLAGLLN